MNPLIGIHNQVKAAQELGRHLDDKAEASAIRDLVWKDTHDPNLLEAIVDGGKYRLIKVDSRSRVQRQRYRWRCIWIPSDGASRERELALERRQEWARAAAETHNGRRIR